MPSVGEKIPECLQTDVCPNCAYNLTALPEGTPCPECGRTLDQSEIILYGWARGSREDAASAKGSRLVWVLILPALWYAFQLKVIMTGGWRWVVLFGAALWIAQAVAGLFRRHDVDHPGLTQVRLSDRGCVQYDSVLGPTLIQELLRAHGWLLPVFVVIGISFAYASRGIGPVSFWIFFPLLLGFAVYLWFPCRRSRRALRQVPDGAAADRNAAFQSAVPWEKIVRFTLRPMKPDTQRLYMLLRSRSMVGVYPVDAEIRCTPEQAEHLNKWLNDRLAVARRPAERRG